MNRDVIAALKDAIRDGPRGSPVDDVVESVAEDYPEADVDDTFDYLKKTGEVYVVPDDDDGDRVKRTPTHGSR